MGANKKYKSSVFATLFADKENLLSLYNAITNSELPADTPVEIATLDDVLFTDRSNDIAFVINGRLVILIEHQSSINENMPLRLLIYAARVYEKLIDNDAVYKRSLLKIPKPDFIVLYNGVDPFPDRKTLRLSSAYMELPEEFCALGGSLELEVQVLNVNEGRNEDIVKKCEALNDYARFIDKVREYQKEKLDLETALAKAAEYCIKNDIMADFLESHASEVLNMFTVEWNLEDAMRVSKQEGREEGIDTSADIMRALLKKVPIDDIATRYGVSAGKVEQLQSVLQM